VTPESIIQEIIRILRIDGELATDGECLEMVSDLLDENGYGPIFMPTYRTGDLGEYGKAHDEGV
jgi:hypothetical protein